MTEREAFEAALELAPEARAAFIEAASGGDPAMRARLAALLGQHDEAGSFLESPAANLDLTADQPGSAERPGTVIGPYKMLEQIGEGGFGVVFLAEQTEPVRRKVALKVLKAGMDTRQVVARFEAERQALAIMDHPNIARVLDGGATPSGRPYFVMELVKGTPITEFCDQHHLTPRQRLELFVPVCQAIQHAHQKGIIHRDIKPSNVLVSRHDSTPVVKVIDFGIAKALGQTLTDKTLFTGVAQMVGTPLYMSPEQAGMSDLDVDTRSDIYSLGVLLYELLTGTTPFTKERFRQAAYDEIRRIIREEEPPKPSTRLCDATASLPSVAAVRQTEPAKLTKLVRGELDWIVMKALEKDRNRRYETANGFAADVQRYLADEPVLACPPSAAYRLRKFARRNRARLAAAAALGLVLLAAGAFAWYADRQSAARESDKRTRLGRDEEAVAALLDQCEEALRAHQADRAAIVLEAAERRAADGGAGALTGRLDRCRADLTLLRKLDDINNFLWTWTYTEPGGGAPTGETIKARLRAALAGYGAVPRETPAAEAAERVKGSLVKERLLAALDWWLAVEQSAWEMLAGDPGSAWVREVLRSADPDPYRDLVRDAVLASDRRTMSALLDRREALAQPARYAAILGAHEGVGAPARRRAILESALRDRPGDLSLLITLGRSYRPNPQDREGVRERVRWFQAAVVADPRSASAHIGLGIALHHKGDQDGAIAEFRKLVELLPNDPRGHLWLGDALENSAGNKAYADEGLISLQKAVDLAPNSLARNSGPALISHAHSRLGYALQKRGDGNRAAINFREALRIDPRNARARGGLGVILFQKGEVDNAIAELRTAIGHSPNDAGLHGFLAFCLLRKRDSDGAAAEFETALRLDPDFHDAPTQLAWILATGPARLRDGKRAVELATRAGERTGWKDPNQFATLAAAYAEVKDFDRAVEYQEKALKSGLAKRGKAPYEQLELYKQKKPYRDPSLARAELAPPPREVKP